MGNCNWCVSLDIAYILALITEDGISENEFRRRVMMARITFTNMRSLVIVQRRKHEDYIESNKMLCPADTSVREEPWAKSLLSTVNAAQMWIF